ncbi:MAG: fatty acid desaturase [Planctomycetota bacterium]
MDAVADPPSAPASGAPEEDYLPPGPGRLAKPPHASPRIYWLYAGVFAAVHALSLLVLVPWLFSWSAVVVTVLGYYLIGAVGINLCYHRLLTHRGFAVPKWLEHTMAVLGVCNLQDAPARWVGVHRMHHQFSDHERDPHSPLVDFLWGHVGWLVYQNSYIGTADFYDRYARDLLRDPFYLKLERSAGWFGVFALHALAINAAGFLAGLAWSGGSLLAGVQLGLSWLVWGVFLRTVLVWHVTWSVNSVTHMWGYCNYATRDESKNNWLIALLTSGEGWHNNHHAQPRSAAHGHRWWELDFCYWTILGLERLGLAKNVIHAKKPTPGAVQDACRQAA